MKRRPLSLTKARTAVTINLFATPGLGSMMARRYVAGIGQLVLFVGGFCLVVVWFKESVTYYYDLIEDLPVTPINYRLAISGGLFSAAGWLWALLTSLRILREAKEHEAAQKDPTRPPVIQQDSPTPDGSRDSLSDQN